MKIRLNRADRPERIKRTVRCTLSFCLAALLAVSIPAAALADTVGEDTVRVTAYDTDTEITATEPAITNGVYQITSAGELYWFAEEVNNGNTSIDAVLCNDITVNEDVLDSTGRYDNGGDYSDWTPIGTISDPYLGTFDGNGYAISGLYYKNTLTSSGIYAGFFGVLGSGASVLDLTITDSYLCGYKYVGGIAGYTAGAAIQGCVNEARVYGLDSFFGGITGCTDDAVTITDCENYGSVYAHNNVAGICGDNNGGSVISYCINGGSISAETEDTAGICGNNDSTSTVTCCFNYGSVAYSESTTVYAVCESNDGKVKNCYFVAGSDSRSTYSDIYALKVTSDEASGGYLCYQLNGQSSEAADLHFYQTLGTDTYPVLDSSHGIVYRVSVGVYSNTAPSSTSSSSSSDSGSSAASSAAQNGTVIKKGKITYVVNSQSAQTVMVKTVKKAAKKITIPSTISYNGVTYSVTKISANACKNCKKLKKVTIGANVTVIGKKAFYNCKKLKTVIFMGRRIQTIKKKAFKGTAKKITVKATSTKIRTYQTLLKKAGISGKAKYVKT